eukprot:SAG11_NODE_14939_length_594_cov_1.030303_2_plen_128_part_00
MGALRNRDRTGRNEWENERTGEGKERGRQSKKVSVFCFSVFTTPNRHGALSVPCYLACSSSGTRGGLRFSAALAVSNGSWILVAMLRDPFFRFDVRFDDHSAQLLHDMFGTPYTAQRLDAKRPSRCA